MEPFDLRPLNPRRWTLKCCYTGCTVKGACIQCDKPKCKAAVHRACVELTDMVHRWAEDEETAVYEIFCKRHAPDEGEDSGNSRVPLPQHDSTV